MQGAPPGRARRKPLQRRLEELAAQELKSLTRINLFIFSPIVSAPSEGFLAGLQSGQHAERFDQPRGTYRRRRDRGGTRWAQPAAATPEGDQLNSGPRILLIDDDEEDRGLSALVLARELDDPRVTEVSDAAAFALAVSRGGIDLVICERELSWSDGGAVLATVRERLPEAPVVVFTRHGDEEAAVGAMKAGAADYLVKSSRGFLKLPAAAAEALEKARQARRVARSEPWLQTLLDRANVGVFRSTLDERLIEANPAVLKLLGVSSLEDALKVDLPTHFLHGTPRGDLLRRLNEEGELQARVIELKREDGSTIWLNVTEVLLLDVDGDIVVDVLLHDISHVKQHEQSVRDRLAELEGSNEELAEFASVASHELREPLRTVSRYAEILAEEAAGKLGKRERESLDFILAGARRMRLLVEDLQRYSLIAPGGRTFEVCDCNTVADQAIRGLQSAFEESGASVRRQGLPTVLGDAGELEQLFQNLLANAIKFRGERPPEIVIGVERGESSWTFSVSDNGIGIAPEDRERIFKSFTRLDPEAGGSGIGLAICRRIVEGHGGRIWVESTPGEGSTFYFSLPIEGRAEGNSSGPKLVRGSGSERG